MNTLNSIFLCASDEFSDCSFQFHFQDAFFAVFSCVILDHLAAEEFSRLRLP